MWSSVFFSEKERKKKQLPPTQKTKHSKKHEHKFHMNMESLNFSGFFLFLKTVFFEMFWQSSYPCENRNKNEFISIWRLRFNRWNECVKGALSLLLWFFFLSFFCIEIRNIAHVTMMMMKIMAAFYCICFTFYCHLFPFIVFVEYEIFIA